MDISTKLFLRSLMLILTTYSHQFDKDEFIKKCELTVDKISLKFLSDDLSDICNRLVDLLVEEKILEVITENIN